MTRRKTKAQLQEELNMWKRIAYIYISRNIYPESGNLEEIEDLSKGKFIYAKEQLLSSPSLSDYKKSQYLNNSITSLINQINK